MSIAWWHRFSAPTTLRSGDRLGPDPLLGAPASVRRSVRPRDTGYACWRMAVPPARANLQRVLERARRQGNGHPPEPGPDVPAGRRACRAGLNPGSQPHARAAPRTPHWLRRPHRRNPRLDQRVQGHPLGSPAGGRAARPLVRGSHRLDRRRRTCGHATPAQGAGMAMETLSCSPTNSAKTAPYRRRSPLSWPGDYRECSSYSTRPTKSC
jgi:hypothetical protein